jgi:hypothetical protein
VEESEGFTRKIEDVREADFRLANRRLQPLGHLTDSRKYMVDQHLLSKAFAAIRTAVFWTADQPENALQSRLCAVDCAVRLFAEPAAMPALRIVA